MILTFAVLLVVVNVLHSRSVHHVKGCPKHRETIEQVMSSTEELQQTVKRVEHEIHYIDACRTGADFGQEDP
jgi:hypothetical protein